MRPSATLPASASPSTLARLPRPYAALPRLRLAALLSTLSCQRPRCSFRPTTAGMVSAPVSDPSSHHPPGCRILGSSPHRLDPYGLGRGCRHSLEPQTTEKPLLSSSHLDQRRTRQTQLHRRLFWPRLPLFSLAAPSAVWLVYSHQTGRLDLHRLHC